MLPKLSSRPLQLRSGQAARACERSGGISRSREPIGEISRLGRRACPEPVYTRGFIRTYSQYLGLNPDSMLDLFGPQRAIEDHVEIRPIPADVAATPRRSFRPLVLLAAVLLFGLVVAYLWGQYTSLR